MMGWAGATAIQEPPLPSTGEESLGDLPTSWNFCNPVSSTTALPRSHLPTGSKGRRGDSGE